MQKLVVFRLKDDAAIYVADLTAGTVERTNENDEGLAADMISALDEGRGEEPLVKGIDLAVAASLRTGASGHYLYPST